MGNDTGRAPEDGRSTDADRFRALYDRQIRAVAAYCARRVEPDRLDDAVAEVFMVAWRHIDDVPEGDRALLWLYRVAHRVVGREWRSRGRRRRLTARVASQRTIVVSSPEDWVIADDETRRVLDAASQLNPSDAEILRLVAWERLSNDEIADVLDIAPNAVHQRLHRARRNLSRHCETTTAASAELPTTPNRGER